MEWGSAAATETANNIRPKYAGKKDRRGPLTGGWRKFTGGKIVDWKLLKKEKMETDNALTARIQQRLIEYAQRRRDAALK